MPQLHWALGVAALLAATPVLGETLTTGSQGEQVLKLQRALSLRGYELPTAGRYTLSTARAVAQFQRAASMTPTGVADDETQDLVYQPLKLGDTGDAVKRLQSLLGVEPSGTFDQATEDAVKRFQTENGLPASGKFSPSSLGKLTGKRDGSFPNGGSGATAAEQAAAEEAKAAQQAAAADNGGGGSSGGGGGGGAGDKVKELLKSLIGGGGKKGQQQQQGQGQQGQAQQGGGGGGQSGGGGGGNSGGDDAAQKRQREGGEQAKKANKKDAQAAGGLTPAQLKQIMPKVTIDEARLETKHLNSAMASVGANTPLRRAAFVAILAAETKEFETIRKAKGSIAGTYSVQFRKLAQRWKERKVNPVADKDDFKKVLKAYGNVSGAEAYYKKAKSVLGG